MSRIEAAMPDKLTVEQRGRRKRRRPSGEPPPLPRDLRRSGRVLLWATFAIMLVLLLVGMIEGLGGNIERVESSFVRWVEGLRTGPVTAVAHFMENAFGAITNSILRWATLLILLLFKRFRHLFVYLASVLLVGFVITSLGLIFTRSRPVGVDIIGQWQGSAIPSRPTATLAATLLGIMYTLIPHGRTRNVAKYVAGATIVLYGLTRIYLGTDHPVDILTGVLFGAAIPVAMFRLLTPNEVFPVNYKRGRTAHLDIEGPRGEAIRHALADQLGLSIVEMKTFGLAGSGGSTPMRLEIEGGDHAYLFAKLYAAQHLRADRWYKLGRTLLYGRLEDEAAFSTVRRLVQYEDYMLRLMRDGGVNGPRPYGFVEITPEREYVIVMEMIEGADELLDRDVSDAMIRNGLMQVRKLWEAGLAHRDIKPSNILARGDDVYLIDVAFGETRPSPWREAVDLANMMLVMSLAGAEPERVYTIALECFTPDEIAEGFAATQRVTVPSQSRQMMKKARGNLVKRFRELAPDRAPVSIQRWSYRRLGLTVLCAFGALIAGTMVVSNLRGAGLAGPPEATRASFALVTREPLCDAVIGLDSLGLVSQSVPTATYIPCTSSNPEGWEFHAMEVRNGETKMFFDSDPTPAIARDHELILTFTASCPSGGDERASGNEDIRRFDLDEAAPDSFTGERRFVFEGGCVTYSYDLQGDDWPNFVSSSSLALDFRAREHFNDEVRRRLGWGEDEGF